MAFPKKTFYLTAAAASALILACGISWTLGEGRTDWVAGGLTGFVLAVFLATIGFAKQFSGSSFQSIQTMGFFFGIKFFALIAGGCFFYFLPELGDYLAYLLSFLSGVFVVTLIGVLLGWNVEAGGKIVQS